MWDMMGGGGRGVGVEGKFVCFCMLWGWVISGWILFFPYPFFFVFLFFVFSSFPKQCEGGLWCKMMGWGRGKLGWGGEGL